MRNDPPLTPACQETRLGNHESVRIVRDRASSFEGPPFEMIKGVDARSRQRTLVAR